MKFGFVCIPMGTSYIYVSIERRHKVMSNKRFNRVDLNHKLLARLLVKEGVCVGTRTAQFPTHNRKLQSLIVYLFEKNGYKTIVRFTMLQISFLWIHLYIYHKSTTTNKLCKTLVFAKFIKLALTYRQRACISCKVTL